MEIGESFRVSLANIRRHKLRSLLTTLGVILGIGAVIATVTLGAGFESFFVGEFAELFAPDAFVVSVGEVRSGPGQAGFFIQPQPIFTDGDVSDLANLASVKHVYPIGFLQVVVPDGVKFRTISLPGTEVVATVPDAYGPSGYRRLEAGTTFGSRFEAVVGLDAANLIAKHLNTTIDGILGSNVTLTMVNTNSFSIQSFNVTVVGALKEQPGGVNNFVAIDRDSYYSMITTRTIPDTTQQASVYELLAVIAENVNQVQESQDDVLNSLRSSSDAAKFLRQDNPNLDFITISVEDVVSFIQQQIGQFASFIASIGLISLLVGSIGISNIMMVAVTERTREIGVLKATGARRRDILQLFLLEAFTIGTLGAIIGVGVGIGLGYALTRSGFFSDLSLPLVFRYEWFPISVGVGMGVGLVSGFYPAWRAAKVNPVEALRYE